MLYKKRIIGVTNIYFDMLYCCVEGNNGNLRHLKSLTRVYCCENILNESVGRTMNIHGHSFHCMYVCMYLCMYVYMYACMYVSMPVCMMDVCWYVCMYAYMYVCLYVCVYVCMYLCMYVNRRKAFTYCIYSIILL